MMTKLLSLILALSILGAPGAFAKGKIQNEDVKTLSELTAAGGSSSQLINDTKIYVTGRSLNKQLSQAITDGDFVAATSQSDLENYSLSVSVAANAATIALKTKAGTDPTGSDLAAFSFRSATATSGTYVKRNVTAALSTVISNGSTGGTISGAAQEIFVYAIDNAGTVELAWSGERIFKESELQSTTAEGGAGAADSGNVLYSTTARTNVAVRYLGKFRSTQATAGTWATSPSLVSVVGEDPVHDIELEAYAGNGYGSTNLSVNRYLNATTRGNITYTDSSTLGASGTILEDGLYGIMMAVCSSLSPGCSGAPTLNGTQLTTASPWPASEVLFGMTTIAASAGYSNPGFIEKRLKATNVIRPQFDTAGSGCSNTCNSKNAMFRIVKLSD